MERIVRNTVWRHYKGGHYRVLCMAAHSENFESLVVYQCLYDKLRIYARPETMFTGPVIVDGKRQRRFEYVGKLES